MQCRYGDGEAGARASTDAAYCEAIVTSPFATKQLHLSAVGEPVIMEPRSTAPLKSAPLRDAISDEIRSRIFSGALPPGTRLVERDLAREFNVSRFPIREAVRMLTQEGIVESLPTRGSVVKVITQDEVQAIFDVREALESLAARLAATRVAQGAHNTLPDYVHAARVALTINDRDAAAQANTQFHDEMIRLAGSAVLHDTLSPLVGRLHWLFRQVPDLASVCDDHESLSAAITAGDWRLAEIEATRHVMHYRRLTHSFLFSPAVP